MIIQYKSRKEVYETDDVVVFSYSLNERAIRTFEFGAFFLLIIASFIYPVTHFEPRQWMAGALALAIAATAAFCTARYWRMFVTTEFIGWDKDNFYVTQGRKGVAVIPWKVLDLNNTGLKDPTSGSVLNIHVSSQDPIVKLRLVSGFIIVDKFQNVLATILTHIKQNLEANGELPKKVETSSEKDVSEAASKPPVSEAAVENAASTSVEENEAAKLSTDVSQSEGLSATKETESNAPAVEAVEKEAESH
ncbi:MAG: hypothetical protein IIY06_00370 [Proteobacteria bacterium]|nr:hypothetical protein [Pseudomonadota bacterium]